MRSTSARWVASIAGSHRLAVRVTALRDRMAVGSPLAVVSGSVTLDRTAEQRGRFDAVFAEPLLVTDASNPLTPFGYELRVERGLAYGEDPDDVELIGLGVFPIQTAQIDGTGLTTSISAMDRSQLVKDARLEDDYQIAAGTNYATAIHDLIDAGVGDLTYAFASTGFTTPLLTFAAETDRWLTAFDMARSIGYDLYFDGDGTLVLTPIGNTSTTAWTIAEGTDGVLLNIDLSLSRATTYNRVIATGENASMGSVPKGVWTDDDTASPTHYGSSFGKKPRFYKSPLLATDAQALQAATAIGLSSQGIAHSLAFGTVPNPALEPGDGILVQRLALGVNEVHVIDKLTIGLAAGDSMTGEVRSWTR